MTAGNSYYLEILHRQYPGDNHVELAVKIPGRNDL